MHSLFLKLLADHKPNPSTFNILHHNSHSLLSKIDHYTTLPHIQLYDIISISETWLKPEVVDSLVEIPNFVPYRSDRDGKQIGGGSAIYIKALLQVKRLQHLKLKSCDSVWLKVSLPSENSIVLASVYVPPSSNKLNFIQEMADVLLDPSLDTSDVIVMGDLNINCTGTS